MKNKLTLYVILSIGLFCNRVQAQDTVKIIHDIVKLDSIQSDILKENRLIEVFLPQNFKPESAERYDVLYVLDGGNWNTGIINKVQRFIEGEGMMPPTIIVSIIGIDRNKDLTPTRMEDWKTSGGAANFLAFMREELIPHINKNYPSNGENTLWGHSLGGLFVVNALLNEPAMFKSYIAVDPSLWWDKLYIPKIAPEKLAALTKNITLFISGREGADADDMKIDSTNAVLKKYAPANLNWKSVKYPDESHSSIRLKTTYDGLRFSYGWRSSSIEFHPKNGMVAKDKPFNIWYFTDTAGVRYTLDGTEPTTGSLNAQPEITLDRPSRLTFRQFSNRPLYDKMKTGEFTPDLMPAPVKKPKNAQSGGFSYAYYEGDWTGKDFSNVKPQQTGITNADFDLAKLPRRTGYMLVIDGLLEVKEDGYHVFAMEADSGTKLYLAGQLLIHWNGNYQNRSSSYILPLKKGFYPLRLEYPHKNEDFKLQLVYLTPATMASKNPAPIPLEVQWRQK